MMHNTASCKQSNRANINLSQHAFAGSNDRYSMIPSSVMPQSITNNDMASSNIKLQESVMGESGTEGFTENGNNNELCHSNARLLIVEDNFLNQFVISLFLKELKFSNIDTALSGIDALSLSKSNQYDLILLDIGLPDMDGIAVCQQLRQLPAYQHIPILALTAFTDSDIKHKCLTAGIDMVLHKPIIMDDLKKALHYWLSRRRKRMA